MSDFPYLPLVFLYTKNREAIRGATKFQKLVFLAQQETKLGEIYDDYRPDRFGPYSPSLRADLEYLNSEGYIKREVETNYYGQPRIVYSLTDAGYRVSKKLLNRTDSSVYDYVNSVKRLYNDDPLNELLQYVYSRYESYVTATEVDTESLFDPDAASEFETSLSTAADSQPTIRDKLRATPHTLYQMPKRDTSAYFYYFTDRTYSSQDSKFRLLDDQLTLMGRHRSQLEVVMFDRDSLREEPWDAALEGLDIDSYPALVASDGPLGVEDLELRDESFEPNDYNYAKLENGIISDRILQDGDAARDFLNTMYDGCRKSEIESTMQKEKVAEALTLGKDAVMSVLSVSMSG